MTSEKIISSQYDGTLQIHYPYDLNRIESLSSHGKYLYIMNTQCGNSGDIAMSYYYDGQFIDMFYMSLYVERTDMSRIIASYKNKVYISIKKSIFIKIICLTLNNKNIIKCNKLQKQYRLHKDTIYNDIMLLVTDNEVQVLNKATSEIEEFKTNTVIFDVIMIENILIYISGRYIIRYDMYTKKEWIMNKYPYKDNKKIKYTFDMIDNEYYLNCSEHDIFCRNHSLCNHGEDKKYKIYLNKDKIKFKKIECKIKTSKVRYEYDGHYLTENDHKYALYMNEDENKLFLTYMYSPLVTHGKNNDSLVSIQKRNFHTFIKKDRDMITFVYWCLNMIDYNMDIYIPAEIKMIIIQYAIQ